MIITLTANPSVDRTLQVPKIRFNEILRTNKARLDWGGKGFNVSRALRVIDYNSLALAWVGGGTGRMLENGLNKLGITTDFVWVEEETRTNTLAREEDGEWYIRLNEPGPHIPPHSVELLFEKSRSYARGGDIWVVSGSLPQDVDDNFYAEMITMLKDNDVRVFFDSSGEPFKKGLESRPFLVNLDVDDAENNFGFAIRNYEDAKRAALILLRQEVEYIAIWLYEQGLLLATQHEMFLAVPPKIRPRGVTGTRDALMAGLVHGFESRLPLIEVARWGAAYAAAWRAQDAFSTITREDIASFLPRVDTRVVSTL